MDNISERNKKIIAIVLVVAVLILGIYKLFFERSNVEEEKIDTETISVVKDNNRFYTVSSCVSKYISYLSTANKENVLVLLSSDYKEKNSVTLENLNNHVTMLNGNKTFIPRKIYEQRISESIYKYYVYGFVQEETIDTISAKEDYYIIVIMDEKNMTFAIEPYDGSMFK